MKKWYTATIIQNMIDKLNEIIDQINWIEEKLKEKSK